MSEFSFSGEVKADLLGATPNFQAKWERAMSGHAAVNVERAEAPSGPNLGGSHTR